ncbi:hypothetical protein KBB96_20210 [Luteolibacter ambystomatis]|uniref:Tetratricopeptide repeat protein n=1 Tax=Luteolibacter ambystomatis TaxID=2824561 RepID=A0A975J009_9BACT|nr:hypothetical protein [Luteolibacter ambystomatis]QUE51165.1 hypothetical protein KBB96_20210 [Luteolibacter ambystomatis]
MNDEELQRIKVGSKQEMQQGIAHLNQGEWQAALGCFDRAVALRETTPWREDGEAAWLLAAAWINRSDALRQLGDARLLPEAIRSLDRGIEAMQHVRLEGDPMFAERLILAWINRGTVCGDAGQSEEALAGFAKADEVLETWGREVTTTRRFMHAMLLVNRSRVLLESGAVEEGWRQSAAGVELLKSLEPGDGLVAQTGIRARGVLCHALALLVEKPGGEQPDDWIAAATDAAEEALAIVKRTGTRDPGVADLVRYGARIYRICQPQFLAEFVREWLAPDGPLAHDARLREEMQGVVQLARAEAETRLRAAPHDDAVAQRELRILKALE